jgi:hypothetical protein
MIKIILMVLFLYTDKGIPQNCIGGTSIHHPESKVLIINAFDAMGLKMRKNKKELFRDLSDSVILNIYRILQNQYKEVIVVPEVIKDTFSIDSMVNTYMVKHNVRKAIVLRSLDAYFDQTDVVVVKNDDKSKTRTAHYDLCSIVNFKVYDSIGLAKEPEFKTCENFTDRTVFSGLLAMGPDIVGKRKHAIRITVSNADRIKAYF